MGKSQFTKNITEDDFTNEHLTVDELASLRASQLKDIEKSLENKSDDINLYQLIFITSIIKDICEVPTYYFDLKHLSSLLESLIKKTICVSNIDKIAKKILLKCTNELKINHTISNNLYEKLEELKFSYYRNLL